MAWVEVAFFVALERVVVSPSGTIYVVDNGNHRISKGVPTQNGSQTVYSWSNFAGKPGVEGSVDGTGSGATFTYPEGLALDGSGNLYVVSSSDTVRKVTPAAVVTTLAGTYILKGHGRDWKRRPVLGALRRCPGRKWKRLCRGLRKPNDSESDPRWRGYDNCRSSHESRERGWDWKRCPVLYPNGASSFLGGHTGASNPFTVTSAAVMSVSPAVGLSASGTIGGPFTVAPSRLTQSPTEVVGR